MAPNRNDDQRIVSLNPIKRESIEIPIVGITPVIPHKWSEKSLTMLRDKQTSRSRSRASNREAKVAADEAEATLYRLEDGRPGMPASAFRAATIAAARLYDGLTMTALKTALFVEGEGEEQLIPVVGELIMREDTPRNSGGGQPDLRYRYMVWPWSALLRVTYMPTLVDSESVVNLVDAGGNGGVGDWRPSAPKSMTGTFGRYEVNLD